MKIRLELNGPLKVPKGGKVLERKIKPGMTVSQVISSVLGYPEEQIKYLLVTRDGEHVKYSQPLLEDCTLRVFMRLGGG